jgi:ASC-1-like (ASCH) protein
MNTIIMHLNSPWFELVRSGKKIYEGRRKTPKIMELKIGQKITIHHYINKNEKPYTICIDDIFFYDTFEDALFVLPIDKVLPLDDITIEKGVEIYKKYVSLETQQKDGVVILQIHVVSDI